MAITKTAYKGTYTDVLQEFVCDAITDISNLPTQTTTQDRCATGSSAFVIEDSSVWMLNSTGTWVEL